MDRFMEQLAFDLVQWPEKKCINGKSFNEAFKLDNMPLSWFYSGSFRASVIPNPVNLTSFIKGNKKIPLRNKIKSFLYSKLIGKYMNINENKKIRCFKKKKSFSKDSKVLFLSFSNHISDDKSIFKIQRIINIIKKKKSIKDFVVFADPISLNNYKKLSNVNNIYQYYDKKIAKKARIASANLYKKVKALDNKTKECMFNIKRNLWPYLKPGFNLYFSKDFMYVAFLYYEIFKKIIEKENIKAVVVTGVGAIHDKSLLAAAYSLKVPSILIQDGLGEGPRDYSLISRVAVFNDYCEKMLIEEGIPKNKMVVVGPIVFDQIYDFIGPKKKKEKKVFIATGSFIEDNLMKKDVYFQRIKIILEEIKKIDGVSVAIKPHPREKNVGGYKKIIEELNLKNVKIYGGRISREEFYSLIHNCDSFIHFGSTSSLEAGIIDRPLITLDIFGDDSMTYWVEKGTTIKITYKDDIRKAVEEALKDEKVIKAKRKKYIKKVCGKVDGKASENVVKLIEKVFK